MLGACVRNAPRFSYESRVETLQLLHRVQNLHNDKSIEIKISFPPFYDDGARIPDLSLRRTIHTTEQKCKEGSAHILSY